MTDQAKRLYPTLSAIDRLTHSGKCLRSTLQRALELTRLVPHERLIAAVLAAPVVLLIEVGCSNPPQRHSDPHVRAGDLRAAAKVCDDRGYSYVAKTGEHTFWCLYSNIDDEPEAIPVGEFLSH
ncbi:MAG: hypothetical protein ABI885_24855 [Gammaproteobacteria bacterium]